jgi:hypothetical protein
MQTPEHVENPSTDIVLENKNATNDTPRLPPPPSLSENVLFGAVMSLDA